MKRGERSVRGRSVSCTRRACERFVESDATERFVRRMGDDDDDEGNNEPDDKNKKKQQNIHGGFFD